MIDPRLPDLLEAGRRDFEDACEAIAKSLAGDPKHDLLFEDYRAQFEAERETRQSKSESLKAQSSGISVEPTEQ